MLISFLFLNKNISGGYSLEAPQQGTSNEYPQHMFSLRNKKKYYVDTHNVAMTLRSVCISVPEEGCNSRGTSSFVVSVWWWLPAFFNCQYSKYIQYKWRMEWHHSRLFNIFSFTWDWQWQFSTTPGTLVFKTLWINDSFTEHTLPCSHVGAQLYFP